MAQVRLNADVPMLRGKIKMGDFRALTEAVPDDAVLEGVVETSWRGYGPAEREVTEFRGLLAHWTEERGTGARITEQDQRTVDERKAGLLRDVEPAPHPSWAEDFGWQR